jgi:hypothetical protein
MLARARKVSLCVAAGAAAASVGLGAVFARELPGHHALTTSVHPGTAQQSSGPAGTGTQQPAGAPQPAQHLTPPQQAPAPAPAAPSQATSGGS